MRTMRFMIVPLLAALFCLGCGPKKPEGIPALSPATVTIVKGSDPVANANVFFVAITAPSGSWSTVGVTDENGVAKMETTQGEWRASGVPEGEYQIYLTKLGKIEEPELPPDVETNPEAKQAYLDERLKRLEAAGKEIPKCLTSNETSDLKISVSGSTAETFDISQYDE